MMNFVIGIIVVGAWSFLFITRFTKIKNRIKIFIGAAVGWLGLSGVLAAFVAKPFSEFIITYGNSDSYAYKVTFLIAAVLILIGMLTYVLYRPKNYNVLILDKATTSMTEANS